MYATGGLCQRSDDCNDGDSGIHPSANEVCDGIDNDCDSLTDDSDDSLDASTTDNHFQDGDGDGYGSPSTVVYSCVVPPDRVVLSGCDDGRRSVSGCCRGL